MGDSGSPSKRRRIAGETRPSAPAAKKVPAKKVATPAKKVVAPAPTPPRASGAAVIAASGQTKTSVAAQRRRKPSLRDLVRLVPALIATIAALALGAWAGYQGIDEIGANDGNRAATEKEASAAASDAAETVFSYTYNELDAHLVDSKKLMTPKFAKEFEKIAPALDEIAPQRKVQVEAVGRNSAALNCGDECEPGTVNVLVFLDQARLVDSAKQPDVIGNRITMKMVHRDGVWLVDDIRAL